MNGFKIIEYSVIIILAWFAVWLTLPFERKYDVFLREYSREPSIRILSGALLIVLTKYSIPAAILWFLILFFWIADVHLVSKTK